MLNYTVKLFGPERDRPVDFTGALMSNLFQALDKGAKGAVRLRLDGRSFAQGTPPAWLSRAALFRFEGVDREHSLLKLSAPSLKESLGSERPEFDLIAERDLSKTGITLLTEGLQDALHGVERADTYDEGLLGVFQGLKGVFNQGVVDLELRNGQAGSEAVAVTPDALEVFSALHPKTIEPEFVRVAGKMNVIRHSDRAFVLQVANGASLRGILSSPDHPPLSEYFGKKVVVSGQAIYRPSGSVLRINAGRIDPANEADLSLWGLVPRPTETFQQKELFQQQGPRTGINAVFGRWPRKLSPEAANRAIDLLTELA